MRLCSLLPLAAMGGGGIIYLGVDIFGRDHVCGFGGRKYGKNGERLRELLESNGAKGIQVLLDGGGFRCAWEIGDEYLEGLHEYLSVVLPMLKGKGVWAVMRDESPDGWTVMDEKNEDIGVLKPIGGYLTGVKSLSGG